MKVTEDASYQIPEAVSIACTLGIAEKPVPAITTFDAALVITVGVKLEIVGLVSTALAQLNWAEPFVFRK